MFSPYYARARRKGQSNPENHCAINVALYGTPRRWAMTERGALRMTRDAMQFKVGASRMAWDGDQLIVDIDERCSPLPFALRGRVTFDAGQIYNAPVQLDETGSHHWQAVAPHGRVTVDMQQPELRWSGFAYHDMNWGNEPLEAGFRQWTWARANTQRGTEVLYDVERRDGSRFHFGRCFKDGTVSHTSLPPSHALPRGFWGMPRQAPSEAPPKILSSLEDAPFYTRDHVGLTLNGEPCEAYHESLSLSRFTHPVVQLMLPFRMPRFA